MRISRWSHGLIFPLLLAGLPAQAADDLPPAVEINDAEVSEGDEGFASAQKVLTQATTEREALRALVGVITQQRRRGDYMDGLTGAREGLARARKLGDTGLQIDFLYYLGRLYWNITEYPQSLENHLEELRLAQNYGNDSILARTHGGLGLTYQRFGRNEEALRHFRLGLEFADRAEDIRVRSSILNSLGNYYFGVGDLDQATTYHEEALKLRESYHNSRTIADSLTNLGMIASERGDANRALDYLTRALTTYEGLKYRRYIANTHRRFGNVLRKAGRTEEALEHLQLALPLAETLQSAEVFADLYLELAMTYEAHGDYALALEYQRKQAQATEQMRGEQDRMRMSELQARFGAEQRELEIALLKRDQQLQKAEIRRRRSQFITVATVLAGGVLLLGVVILLQRYRLRSERRVRRLSEHARERAEAAERLKSRLLQIASHDLKVPLTALNATAGLIGGNPSDEPAVRRLAGNIQADTARMRSLVRDFLDAAAMEEGNLQLHTAVHELAEIVEGAVASLEPVAQVKSQRLVLERRAVPLPRVRADGERLRQVFDNLIGNALKFTPVGGTVTMALGEAGGWVFAEVRDSGPGLGPADFARIFSPHQRLSALPTGKDEESTGLGLFIARELLTLQGGRLEVQSQPGSGAVFRVLLPVATGGAA